MRRPLKLQEPRTITEVSKAQNQTTSTSASRRGLPPLFYKILWLVILEGVGEGLAQSNFIQGTWGQPARDWASSSRPVFMAEAMSP